MNYLIIEDEALAAERLLEKITELRPHWNCLKVLGSIKELNQELQNSTADLAFVDIHLGDGSSFVALEKWKVQFPLIFTTAYDQYAIKAFKLNSIDYLLKPIHSDDLEVAINKLEAQAKSPQQNDFSALLAQLKPQYKERFLVSSGEKLRTVRSEEIAFFHASGKHCFLTDAAGREYIVDLALKDLAEQLNPQQFFQINRQYLINLNFIKELVPFSKSRVKVLTEPPLPEEGIVSSERSARFKLWLQGELS